MTNQFKLPDLGEGVHEGQIIKLLVKEGETVAEDQPLMEVETDKAAVEIPSPYAGVITKWHVEESQVVNVGDVMVTFEGGEGEGDAQGRSDSTAETRSAQRGESLKRGSDASSAAIAKPSAVAGRHKPASPATRKLARVLKIDINSVAGSGPGGRVTRADVERASEASSSNGATSQRDQSRMARPSPKQPAQRKPLDFSSITGEDTTDAYGNIKKHTISQARKTIAANMAKSWSTIPHVTDCDDADVTELEKLRKGYLSPDNGNRKITMLAFIIRAVAQALRRHPEFNAHFDSDNQHIIYKNYINIAVGVHTERGLVAPVIRDADSLDVIGIADALDAMIGKARTASFSVNETRGGTYSISNAGAFGGSHYSTPIVTPGQCGVLAIGRSRKLPWIVDDQIVPRLIMPLSHSFDHRVADGGQEIAFLQDIIGQLENPARLLM